MSVFKLAIVAGHYMNTPGKRCDQALDPKQTREWWLNDRVVDYIIKGLDPYNIEIKRLDDPTGKKDISLKERTDAANAWKADFYLSIHHNAGVNGGSGGGIVAFVYSNTTDSVTLAWQKELYNALIAKTGLNGNRSTPLAKANLHECRETSMPAVLLELGFMDSKTDVPIILTDAFAKKCADACVEVIVKRAKLTKKTTATTATATVKTYKVVTPINKYSTAADAKAKKNAKADKLAVGTYYIFNKYPNGVDGMYNISTDKTGASAGSWINPAENVVAEAEESVQKVYRVRKSKDDAKSQVGAYSSLDNAKDACQKAGDGYSVFDWNWKVVYTYEAPKTTTTTTTKTEEPKKETTTKTETTTKVTVVYDLAYAEKNKIVDKTIARTNEDCVKAISLIKKNNTKFDHNIAIKFFELAPIYGIDPVMAIAQSCLETGWFKYSGSAVTPAHHNYCGLGVTTTGQPGSIFDSIEGGVTAQLQHLYAYGCKEAVPAGEKILDPRFSLVTRGIAPYWQQLAGRWAVPGYDKNTYSTPEDAMKAGNTYGQKIRALYSQIMSMSVTDTEVLKYFQKDDVATEESDKKTEVAPVEPEVNPSVETVKPDDGEEKIDSAKVNKILGLLEKILNYILNWFSKGE